MVAIGKSDLNLLRIWQQAEQEEEMRYIQGSDSLSYNTISDKWTKIYGTSDEWGLLWIGPSRVGKEGKEAFEEGCEDWKATDRPECGKGRWVHLGWSGWAELCMTGEVGTQVERRLVVLVINGFRICLGACTTLFRVWGAQDVFCTSERWDF